MDKTKFLQCKYIFKRKKYNFKNYMKNSCKSQKYKDLNRLTNLQPFQ